MFHHLRAQWRTALGTRRARWELGATLAVLGGLLMGVARLLAATEGRNGWTPPDPLLAMLPPVDVTWLLFPATYGGVLLAVGMVLGHPPRLLLGLRSYCWLLLFRLGSVALLPLNPPPGIIPLTDPFVALGTGGVTLLQDLFFSGHTATLFLLGLIVPGPRRKGILFTLCLLVSAGLLWQHVHYTIDLLAAPLFAIAAYLIAARRLPRLGV